MKHDMKHSFHSKNILLSIILGCTYESGIHYESYDVDYSPFMPDLQGCLLFCESKSRFFTYDEIGYECYCKSSNAEPFEEEGTVSGESGCPTGKPHKVISKKFGFL